MRIPRQVRTLIAVGVVVPLGIALFASSSDVGPVLVIVFVIGFIALSFKMAGGMLRGFSGQDVIDAGVPARAVITSMAETGTTVNDHPMVDFGLRVTLDDGTTFEHTAQQMLPRLLLGQVRPGADVSVAVVATESGHDVAIDWQRTAGGDPDAARITEGHLAGTPLSGEVVERGAFLARAISATGELDAVSETGQTGVDPATGRSFDAYGFTVTVMRAGREPYQAELVQGIPDDLVGRVGPGARVPIGINPDDERDIIIDWDSHRGGPPPIA